MNLFCARADLVLATLRLPLAVWLVLLFSELVFIFVFLATFADGGALRVIAGLCCIGAVLAGAVVFYGSMSSSTGGAERSLGRRLVK